MLHLAKLELPKHYIINNVIEIENLRFQTAIFAEFKLP